MADPTAPETDGEPPAVLVERVGLVEVITLNRPRVHNAINYALRTGLDDALRTFDEDDGARVAVVTGAGGTFCAGRDLKAVAAGEPTTPSRVRHLRGFSRASVRKPVIAAVEGYALAGGFELALSCDLVVAARTASFGLPEVKRNLVAVGGGLIRLPRRIPYHLAMLVALTGDRFTAEQMADWGVVVELTEPGGARAAALALAERIAANGPLAVVATKEIIRRAYDGMSEADAFDAQTAIAEPARESADRQEGVRAFLEKRPPVWRGR